MEVRIMTLKQLINKIVTDNNGDVFLDNRQVARTLDISTTTLHNYRSVGILQAIKRGRKVYFRVEDIAIIMRDGADTENMRERLEQASA